MITASMIVGSLIFVIALILLAREINKSAPLEEPYRPQPKNKKQSYRRYACVDDSMLVAMITFERAVGNPTGDIEEELNRRNLYVVDNKEGDIVKVERRDESR